MYFPPTINSQVQIDLEKNAGENNNGLPVSIARLGKGAIIRNRQNWSN